MSFEQDQIKSLRFETPEFIPVSAGILPAAWMQYRSELEAIVDRYKDVVRVGKPADGDYDAVGGTYREGEHIDEWGSVWSNIQHGMESFVTGHPVATREAVHTLQQPERDAGLPHGFMFLRLTYLRGFEETMIDFAEEPPELQRLIDTVLAYNLRQGQLRLDSLGPDPRLIYFGDDLGMQDALPMHPDVWRKYLIPCFRQIYAPFVEAGHYVYMHSDGHIWEIIPDLIDCGVNVINPQIRANGFDSLARVCKGKVCVDLDLDRQMFPFCSPEDIDAHVREAVETLGAPEGGLWLKAELNFEIPLENIEAIFAALAKYRTYYS